MNNRILDKIEEIERYISELEEIKPETLKDYTGNMEKKAACERYAEKIGQALVDLAFLFIKQNNFESPEDDSESFDILFNHNLISSNLRDNLQQAKGMRNILAHEYGEIDDEIVFHAISEELIRDGKEFIKVIKELNAESGKKSK